MIDVCIYTEIHITHIKDGWIVSDERPLLLVNLRSFSSAKNHTQAHSVARWYYTVNVLCSIWNNSTMGRKNLLNARNKYEVWLFDWFDWYISQYHILCYVWVIDVDFVRCLFVLTGLLVVKRTNKSRHIWANLGKTRMKQIFPADVFPNIVWFGKRWKKEQFRLAMKPPLPLNPLWCSNSLLQWGNKLTCCDVISVCN